MPPKKKEILSSTGKSKSRVPAGVPALLDVSTLDIDVCSHILAFLICGYCLSYKEKFNKNIIYPLEQELRLQILAARSARDPKSETSGASQTCDVEVQQYKDTETRIKFQLADLLIKDILSQKFGIPISIERLFVRVSYDPAVGMTHPLHIHRVKSVTCCESSPSSSSAASHFEYCSGSESEPDFFDPYRYQPDPQRRFKKFNFKDDFPELLSHVETSPFVTRTRGLPTPLDGNVGRSLSPTSKWMSPTRSPAPTLVHGEVRQAYKCYHERSRAGLHLAASDGVSLPIPCFMCNMYLFSLNYDPRGIHFNISNRWGIPRPEPLPETQTPTKKGAEKDFPTCDDFVGGIFFDSLFSFALTIQNHINQSEDTSGTVLSAYFQHLKKIPRMSDGSASPSSSFSPPSLPDRGQSFGVSDGISESFSDFASPSTSTTLPRLGSMGEDFVFASPSSAAAAASAPAISLMSESRRPAFVSPLGVSESSGSSCCGPAEPAPSSFSPSRSVLEGDTVLPSSSFLQPSDLAIRHRFSVAPLSAVNSSGSPAFCSSRASVESLSSPSPAVTMSASASFGSTPTEKTRASAKCFELAPVGTTMQNVQKALEILSVLTQVENPSLLPHYKVILYTCCLKATTGNSKPMWTTFYEWASLVDPRISDYIKLLNFNL